MQKSKVKSQNYNSKFKNYRGIFVQKVPSFFRLFPFNQITGVHFFGKILLNEKLYNEFNSDNVSLQTLATLEHEFIHAKRSRSSKFLLLLLRHLKYWFIPKFRLNEEVEATKAEMKIYKKKKFHFDFEKKAKTLSSYKYLYMVNFKAAKNILGKIWKKI